VVADTSEIARHAASLVRLDYQQRAHDVELRADRGDLYAPELLNAGFETDTKRYAMHALGAQFAEVRVHADTGEVRVPRLLGVFATGQIINAKLGRSQLLGGMTWGLSMALHEHSVLDPRFGHVANQDFATYHIAANADVGTVEVHWLDEEDPHVNPMGPRASASWASSAPPRRSPTPPGTPPASACVTCRSPSTSSCKKR
jgi:CO/xanthine dehydrogenase Mo-binding subunit